MPTPLEQAHQCIKDEKYEDAIRIIKTLSKEDLEEMAIGVKKDYRLFDYAVLQGRLDVANAIIERYAEVADNSELQRIKPLAIDYKTDDRNTQIFSLNYAPFMSAFTYDHYATLVDRQKTIFLIQIEEKSKELRIMGLEKLLKLTTDPKAHKELEKALTSYKADSSPNMVELNQAMSKALKSLGSEEIQTLRYKKMEACLNTATALDRQCTDFRRQDRYIHTPLAEFKNSINGILKHPENEILKHSRGPGEVLASIGNFLMRYTGIGFAVAAVQGKFEEYKQKAWDICNAKTASETKIDEIGSEASSVKPHC